MEDKDELNHERLHQKNEDKVRMEEDLMFWQLKELGIYFENYGFEKKDTEKPKKSLIGLAGRILADPMKKRVENWMPKDDDKPSEEVVFKRAMMEYT
jgi:hypothetical protein